MAQLVSQENDPIHEEGAFGGGEPKTRVSIFREDFSEIGNMLFRCPTVDEPVVQESDGY